MDRGEGTVVKIGFHARQRGDQFGVADAEADAPARHREGLRHRGELDSDVLRAGHFEDRAGRLAVVIEFGIGEVGKDPDLVLARPGHEPFVEGQIDRFRGGIARVIDHQHRRTRDSVGHRIVERLPVAFVGRGRHRADRRTRDDEAVCVDRIGGTGRKDDVARRADRGRHRRETFLRAHRHHHFALGIEIDVEAAAVVIGLRLTQARDAFRLRIAMRGRLGRDFAQFVDHMLRRGLVGIAHAQIDDVAPRLPRGMPHRIDFGDDIGGHAFDAVEFVGHPVSFGIGRVTLITYSPCRCNRDGCMAVRNILLPVQHALGTTEQR